MVMLTRAESRCRPAFATKMSIVPKFLDRLLEHGVDLTSFDTSALMAIPLRPSASIALITLSVSPTT